MILTLKLLQWQLAESLPESIRRVQSWGFKYVTTRQLAYDHQEVCLAALRTQAQRRVLTKRSKTSRGDASSND